MEGVEAVIDKDRTSALLALGLDADALLLLTDVPAVYRDFGAPNQNAIGTTTPAKLGNLDFPPGSMGPKVAAAVAFATASGKLAGIGQLTDARAILEGRAGTRVLEENPEARQGATDETLAQQPVVSGVRGKQ
jgi:carbamate kinase